MYGSIEIVKSSCEYFLPVDRLRHKSAELKFGWGCRFLFCHLAVSPFPDSTFRREQSQNQFHFPIQLPLKEFLPNWIIFFWKSVRTAQQLIAALPTPLNLFRQMPSDVGIVGYATRNQCSELGGKIYANFFSLRIFPYVPGGGVFQVFLLKQDFPSHLVRSLTFTDRSAQKWWPKQKILICVTVLSELSQELFDLKMKMSGLSIFLCKMAQHLLISDTVSFILALWEWEWLSSKAKLELLPKEHW